MTNILDITMLFLGTIPFDKLIAVVSVGTVTILIKGIRTARQGHCIIQLQFCCSLYRNGFSTI